MAERHGLVLERSMGRYTFAVPDDEHPGCLKRKHRTVDSLQEARIWIDGYLSRKIDEAGE